MIKDILNKISKNSFSIKPEDKHLSRLQNYYNSIQIEEKLSHCAQRSNHKLISFKKNNIFLNTNRVEKEVVYKNKKEYLRFFDYPWHGNDENDENLKNEISNINIRKNVNNAFIKIIKLHTHLN